MGFFEAVIRALLTICGFVLVYYIVLWVLSVIGFVIPAQIEKIIMVMIVLVCILILARLFYPFMSGSPWWPRRPPQ